MRLIDADELLLNNTWLWYDENGNHTIAGEAIEDAPTVDPVKHGHNTGEDVRWFKCSICGWGFNDIFMTDESHIGTFPNYCPNCGAKID